MAAAVALAACGSNGNMVAGPGSSDDLSSEAPNSNSIAGGQSGTEGQRAGACSCRLGKPLYEASLDAETSAEYPFAYSPNELFDIVEGTHTFYCPNLGETLVVEIVRGDAAHVLSGIQPSDTGGKDRTCQGVELDATLSIQGSNGLSASASTLQLGSDCGLNYPGFSVLSEVKAQATRGCQTADAMFYLYDASRLRVQIGRDVWDDCRPPVDTDASVPDAAQTANPAP